jgi:hypothetical protein
MSPPLSLIGVVLPLTEPAAPGKASPAPATASPNLNDNDGKEYIHSDSSGERCDPHSTGITTKNGEKGASESNKFLRLL